MHIVYNRWTKLAVGDLCYVHGSYHREEEIGGGVEIQAGRERAEPHIKFITPSGAIRIRDYQRLGYGGPPKTF